MYFNHSFCAIFLFCMDLFLFFVFFLYYFVYSFSPMYIDAYFLFVYNFTYHSHGVENQLHLMNIIFCVFVSILVLFPCQTKLMPHIILVDYTIYSTLPHK